MSTVEEYKAAMNELAAATKEFQPIADFIKKLKDAAGYSPHSFLQANFHMKVSSQGDPSRSRIDMKTWPTGETVTTTATRLAKAFNAAHACYAALAADDREYVKSPPHYPEIK